jgi:alkylation response protein AidB-like acyl-CoA dehydrogenase
MPFELTARSEPGGRLVALAETLPDEIAPRAAAHDRDASFPFDSFAILKESGYFTAPIPEALGGLGVTSLHDVVVASSRLARGDAALTLATCRQQVQSWAYRSSAGRRSSLCWTRSWARGLSPAQWSSRAGRASARRRSGRPQSSSPAVTGCGCSRRGGATPRRSSRSRR